MKCIQDMERVYDEVIDFFVDHKITCAESVWQGDRDLQCMEFVDRLLDLIKHDPEFELMVQREMEE